MCGLSISMLTRVTFLNVSTWLDVQEICNDSLLGYKFSIQCQSQIVFYFTKYSEPLSRTKSDNTNSLFTGFHFYLRFRCGEFYQQQHRRQKSFGKPLIVVIMALIFIIISLQPCMNLINKHRLCGTGWRSLQWNISVSSLVESQNLVYHASLNPSWRICMEHISKHQ